IDPPPLRGPQVPKPPLAVLPQPSHIRNLTHNRRLPRDPAKPHNRPPGIPKRGGRASQATDRHSGARVATIREEPPAGPPKGGPGRPRTARRLDDVQPRRHRTV